MSVPDIAEQRNVAIDDIYKALINEWASLSNDVEASTGQHPLRTSTLTLAIIATTQAAATESRQALHQLATSIPSRVILFKLVPPGAEMTAQVWAHCAMTPDGRPGHCYDVIEIDVPDNEVKAIPNIIATHRLGELPTFVFCNGPLDLQSDTIRRVSIAADRMIIDSERFDSHLKALLDYAMFLGTRGASCAGSDLAWTRISTWRELIAQSFDSPSTSILLPDVTQIDIAFDTRAEAGATLLASWLLSRLQFEPLDISQRQSSTTLIASNGSTNQRLIVNLDRSQSSGVGIRSVRIQARSANDATQISIRRQNEARTAVTVDTTGVPRQERIVQHLNHPNEELIGAELMRFKRDRIFEEAIAIAAAFARLSLTEE